MRASGIPRWIWTGGARHVIRLREMDAAALAAACGKGFDGVRHLAQTAKLTSETPVKLAEVDAFRAPNSHRFSSARLLKLVRFDGDAVANLRIHLRHSWHR